MVDPRRRRDSSPPRWQPGGIRGPGYYKNIYNYPNSQEAGTIWFHDHALGATRTNVYAGVAAFWFIRDQFDTGNTLGNRSLQPPRRTPGNRTRLSGPAVRHKRPVALSGWLPCRIEWAAHEPRRPSLLEPGVFRRCHRGQRPVLAFSLGGAPALPLPPAERVQCPGL